MLLPTSVLVWSNLCSTTRVFRRFSQDLSEIGNIPSGKLTWLWKITYFKGLTNQIWGLARVYMVSITYIITGWWFGTCFFHSVGNNAPNWLSFFQRGRYTTNQHILIWRFPKISVPLYRWMVHFMETPLKMDDLGVPWPNRNLQMTHWFT